MSTSVNKFCAWLSTFIFCFLFWLLLTWSVAARELILGVVIAAVVSLLASRFLIRSKAFYLYNPIRLITLIFYLVIIFMWEVIKANLAMVSIVLSPNMKDYKPGIIRVPAGEKPKSTYGLSLVSNCITLTPGTITMDVAEDEEGKHYYYIHWIDVAETDRDKAADAIKGTMEKWIGRIWE